MDRESKAAAKIMMRQDLWKAMRRVLCYCLTVAIVMAMARQATARQVFDMVGRQLRLPEHLQRIYVASPPENFLACAIDPALMVGLTLPLKQGDQKFLPAKLWDLPVIGGFYGQGHTPNLEVLLKARPQLVICWQRNAIDTKFDAFLKRFDIPVAYFTLTRLQDYPDNIRLMGRLLDRPQRSERLAEYAEATLRRSCRRSNGFPLRSGFVSTMLREPTDSAPMGVAPGTRNSSTWPAVSMCIRAMSPTSMVWRRYLSSRYYCIGRR